MYELLSVQVSLVKNYRLELTYIWMSSMLVTTSSTLSPKARVRTRWSSKAPTEPIYEPRSSIVGSAANGNRTLTQRGELFTSTKLAARTAACQRPVSGSTSGRPPMKLYGSSALVREACSDSLELAGTLTVERNGRPSRRSRPRSATNSFLARTLTRPFRDSAAGYISVLSEGRHATYRIPCRR